MQMDDCSLFWLGVVVDILLVSVIESFDHELYPQAYVEKYFISISVLRVMPLIFLIRLLILWSYTEMVLFKSKKSYFLMLLLPLEKMLTAVR